MNKIDDIKIDPKDKLAEGQHKKDQSVNLMIFNWLKLVVMVVVTIFIFWQIDKLGQGQKEQTLRLRQLNVNQAEQKKETDSLREQLRQTLIQVEELNKSKANVPIETQTIEIFKETSP